MQWIRNQNSHMNRFARSFYKDRADFTDETDQITGLWIDLTLFKIY